MGFSIREIVPDAKAGAVNLTCPQCKIPVDFLDIQEYSLREIHPNHLFPCPNCPTWFWPENGLLFQLHENNPDAFFGSPLTLGATSGLNDTDVQIGRSTEFERHRIDEGYVIESTILLGIQFKDSEAELEAHAVNGAFTTASLGDDVFISIVPTGDASVALNATFREEADESVIGSSDVLSVQYRYVKSPKDAINPPWIDLLNEASLTIRRGNTFAMYPLLVSAMDNFLYRQCLLFYRWQGYSLSEAQERVDSFGGRFGPTRFEIVEALFTEIDVDPLTESPYASEWEEFCRMNNERNSVVHPDANLLNEVSRDEAIRNFNQVMHLMLMIFDHIWFE